MKKDFNLQFMILSLLLSFTCLIQSGITLAADTNSIDPNEPRNSETHATQACNTSSGFCEKKNSAMPDRHAKTASPTSRPNNPEQNDSTQ